MGSFFWCWWPFLRSTPSPEPSSTLDSVPVETERDSERVTRDLSVRLRREWESQMLTTEDSHREAEAASVRPVHSDITPVERGTVSHSEDKYGRNCIIYK